MTEINISVETIMTPEFEKFLRDDSHLEKRQIKTIEMAERHLPEDLVARLEDAEETMMADYEMVRALGGAIADYMANHPRPRKRAHFPESGYMHYGVSSKGMRKVRRAGRRERALEAKRAVTRRNESVFDRQPAWIRNLFGR